MVASPSSMYDLWLEALPGADPAAALRSVFPVDPATATRIVETLPRYVRRGLSAEEARSYHGALSRIGAKFELRSAANAPPPMSVSMPRPPSSASIALPDEPASGSTSMGGPAGAYAEDGEGFDFSGSFDLDIGKKAAKPPPPAPTPPASTPPASSGSLDDESVDLYGHKVSKDAPALALDEGALRQAQGGFGAGGYGDPMAAYDSPSGGGGGGLEDESVDLYGHKLDPNAPALELDEGALRSSGSFERPADSGSFGTSSGHFDLHSGSNSGSAPRPTGPTPGYQPPAAPPGAPAYQPPAYQPPPAAAPAPGAPQMAQVSQNLDRREKVEGASRSGRALSNDGLEGMPVSDADAAEEKREKIIAGVVGGAISLVGLGLLVSRMLAEDSMLTGTAGFGDVFMDGLAIMGTLSGPALLITIFASGAAPMPSLFAFAKGAPGMLIGACVIAFGINHFLEPTSEELQARRIAAIEAGINDGEYPEAGAFLFEPNHSMPGVSQADAQRFITQLTSAGAGVFVTEQDEYSASTYAFKLLLRMPADPALRRVIGNRYRTFLGAHASTYFPEGAQPPSGGYWEIDVGVHGR